MNTKAASGRKIANGSCWLHYEVIVISVMWGATAAAAAEFFSGTQNSGKAISYGTLRIAVKRFGNVVLGESMLTALCQESFKLYRPVIAAFLCLK